MRVGKVLWLAVVLAMVVAVAASCGGGSATNEEQAPEQGQGQEPNPAPQEVADDENSKEEREEQAQGPEDTSLKLTVPKMERIKNVEVPYAAGEDEDKLKNYHAIHLKGTDYPWEEEANVYIAGHRLGYANSNSYLAFYDLDKLQNGDEIIVTDSEGTEYTYRVNKQFVVDPTDVYVTDPVEGKNIVTLQACTLPDYSRRLIVQGELVES